MPKNKLTKRKERALATHQKIWENALWLFSKEGYDNVTIDDICEKVGVSKGAFYHHFKSKDQVIIDIFLRADAIYEEYASTELPRHKNITEKLFLFLKKSIVSIKDIGIDITQVTFRSQINLNGRIAAIASEKRALYKITQKLVEEGQANGEIRRDLNRDDIMRMLIRCARGVIYDWCLVSGHFDLEKEAEKTLSVIMKGLRPD